MGKFKISRTMLKRQAAKIYPAFSKPLLKASQALTNSQATLSYSQTGEDLILQFLFNFISISRPNYLDLGAHHPSYLSNTYLFYNQGSQGVCVEANPDLVKNFKKKRPRDLCLNVAITAQPMPTATFYILKGSEYSSLIQPKIIKGHEEKMLVENVIQIPAMTVNEIMAKHFPGGLDLLSIDLEGLDLEIIQSIDLEQYRPKVICAETLFVGNQQKCQPLIDYLVNHGYYHYADTFINDIFVDYNIWRYILPAASGDLFSKDHPENASRVNPLMQELYAANYLLIEQENFVREHQRQAEEYTRSLLEAASRAEEYARSLEQELEKQRTEYARLEAAYQEGLKST